MEIFSYSFMIRAFIAGGIIAVIAPLIGSFLVIKRLSLVADTLSHAALAGVAVGLLTGTQPILITVAVTILVSILIEKIRVRNISGDAVLAMLLPGGLSIALVLLSIAHGFNTNLFSYLFGSISTVQTQDIIFIGILGLITLATITFFYKQFLFISFDEESARVAGVAVQKINLVLMILTAITVALSLRVIGTLLISALMVIPVVSAMQITKSFKQSLIVSVLFAQISVFIGLFFSYYLDLPAGASIVLSSLVIFGLTALHKK